MSESTAPKPGPRPDPKVMLEALDELERDEQITSLENIHAELTARLKKAQG